MNRKEVMYLTSFPDKLLIEQKCEAKKKQMPYRPASYQQYCGKCNDLISRSAVIEEMNNLLKSPYVNSTQFGAERREIIGIVKKICVEKIPTAYDVDKVIDELKCKECEKCNFLEVCAGSKHCGECHNKAIEIVKAGGVNE